MPRIPKKEISCPAPIPGVQADTAGPFKPIPKCDPPIVAPVPDFNPITPAQGAVDFVELPISIDLSSPEVSKDCTDFPARTEGDTAPLGDSVFTPAGEFTTSVYFQALGLQRDDLYYIAQVMAVNASAVKNAALEGDLAGLCALLNLSETDGQLIIDAVQEAVSSLEEQAISATLVALECYWYNDPQAASCPVGSELGESNPAVIDAGEYRSSYSQADANAKALAAAERALVCVFVNDEQTAVCSDLSDDFNDLNPGTEGLNQNVGDTGVQDPSLLFNNQAVVPAGSFTSDISKADAN
jgi:hypothetical protein